MLLSFAMLVSTFNTVLHTVLHTTPSSTHFPPPTHFVIRQAAGGQADTCGMISRFYHTALATQTQVRASGQTVGIERRQGASHA